MIVWLNGTFGAGKTTTGAELRLRREADLVLDTATLTAAQAAREIASAPPGLAQTHS